MSLLKKIHPDQPLKELRWFDIGIVTLIMFGQFIVRSTQMYLASLSPSLSTAISETSTNTASEGAAYSSNFTLQIILLALAIIYLWIRHFDFKQLSIRLKWSVLFWVPFIFAIMGLFADMVSTLSGQYNYFSPQVLAFISPMAVINKFMALSPMAIAYGLLNGFYEEFFFLGLLTSVKDKYKWSCSFQPLFVCLSIPIRACYGLWLSVWPLVSSIISFISTRLKTCFHFSSFMP